MTGHPPDGVVDRPYFSSALLWTAEHQTALAHQIEEARAGDSARTSSWPWIEHRAHVLSAILATGSFLDAMVNELFQDVADDYRGLGESAVVPHLPQELRDRMKGFWTGTREGRCETLRKYEFLVPMKHADHPFADAELLLRIRNEIVHPRPRDNYRAPEAQRLNSELEKREAAGELRRNPIVWGSDRAPWPELWLGSSFGGWAIRAACDLAVHVSTELGIRPHFIKQFHDPSTGEWLGAVPGAREAPA